MKSELMLMFAANLLISACSGSSGVGGLQIDQLPANVASPCPRPELYLGVGDWEIMAGRLGDELIECGREKDIAVSAYEGVRGSVQ